MPSFGKLPLLSLLRRGGLLMGGLAVIVVGTKGYAFFRGLAAEEPPIGVPEVTATPPAPGVSDVPVTVHDSLFGRSGALRFATLTAADTNALPGFVERFGELALHRPAALRIVAHADSFTLLVLRPFAAKRGEVLNGYRLGLWPAEKWLMQRAYLNPDGFVEVMPGDEDIALSPHFRLRDFLTHDQDHTWPKYVVLEEKLIDKLELVLADLSTRGMRTDRVVVLSGFRAPYYNDARIDEGAARASRHQFGDAADLIIDADGDGRMDDLNGDGRLDLRDIEPVSQAVQRVEAQYPELTGGLGTYAAMGPSGPFAHIDVRGTSARWEREGRSGAGNPSSK